MLVCDAGSMGRHSLLTNIDANQHLHNWAIFVV